MGNRKSKRNYRRTVLRLPDLDHDSDVSAGLVYTPESKLYGLDFDGDPAGRGGTSLSRQRVEKVECPIPFHVYINPNGRLNCFSKQAVPPHSVMSPNLEPY